MEERYGIERQHDSYLSFLSHFTISFPLNSRSPSVSLFGSSTKPFCKPTPGQGAHLQDRTRKRAKKGAFASTGREDTSGYLARLSTTQSSLASWLGFGPSPANGQNRPLFPGPPVTENNTGLISVPKWFFGTNGYESRGGCYQSPDTPLLLVPCKLDIISLNKPSLFTSACIEVESAFEVPTDSSEDMDSLIFSFELVLGLRELFSGFLTTTAMNKGLPL
jgi:hypothetical protein